MPLFKATALAFCNGPYSLLSRFLSDLNKSTSYLSLCLSLNSLCAERSRTWASLGPETRSVISVGRPWVLAEFELQPHGFKSQAGFWLGLSPSAKSIQSCQLFVTPTDCSLPGFPVHGILQARILEWVAISFSRNGCPDLHCMWPQHKLLDLPKGLPGRGWPQTFDIKLWTWEGKKIQHVYPKQEKS